MIQQRIIVCDTQLKLWQYYTWFVGKSSSSSVGSTSGADVKTQDQQYQQQYHEWSNFQKACQQAITAIQQDGSTSVTISPQIMVPFTTLVATDSTVTPTSTTSSA